MKNILILYPKQFSCRMKFTRKISRIVKNIEDYSITYPEDPNDLICPLFSEQSPNIVLLEKIDWNLNDITHAIIFDDGEEFTKETEMLKTNNIPLRVIQTPITRVINIKKRVNLKAKKALLIMSTSGEVHIGEILILCMKMVTVEMK